MNAAITCASTANHYVPEPCLINPSEPQARPSIFSMCRTLFGYDVQYIQSRKNGSRYTTTWHSHSLIEAVSLLQQKLDEKICKGHMIVGLNQYGASEKKAVSAQICEVFWINPKKGLVDRKIFFSCDPAYNRTMLAVVKDKLNSIMRMPDDAKSNVVRLVPPIQFAALSRPLRSFFTTNSIILSAVFGMEDDGVIFVGDFVQLGKEQIDKYTKNPGVTDKMIAHLERYQLSTGMVVKRWQRPSTFGIMM